MAWCDVVEPRTLRECRIMLGKSQAAFAAMLGVSPESYRTWDAERRATRHGETHRDGLNFLLPVLGCSPCTSRRCGRRPETGLPVTYRHHLPPAPRPRDSRHRQGVSAVVLWADGPPSRSAGAPHMVDSAGRLRCPHPGRAPEPGPESGAVRDPGGRRAEGRRLSVGSTEALSLAGVLATDRHALPHRRRGALLHEYPLRVGRRGPHFSGPSAGVTLQG